MKARVPLSMEKKLNVLYRVEPGCLGPDGESHIQAFCQFAEAEAMTVDPDFVHWQIVPRSDKSLPEMEYRVNQKKLTHDKAEKYLVIFGKSLDEFEEHLHDKLGELIEQFLGR